MSSLRLAPVVTSALLLLSACGGKVVFQEDGGEGGEGASGANGPGSGANGPGSGASGPGPGPDTVSSTATGTMPTPCEQLCAQHPECFEGADCIGQCQSFYVDGCEAQTDALLLCFTAVLGPGCSPPPGDACAAESQAYEQCQGGGQCQTNECGVSDQSCQCFGQCFNVDIEQSCYFVFAPGGGPPPAPVQCDCFSNGDYFGSCPQNELDCELSTGCCQFLLGQDG